MTDENDTEWVENPLKKESISYIPILRDWSIPKVALYAHRCEKCNTVFTGPENYIICVSCSYERR